MLRLRMLSLTAALFCLFFTPTSAVVTEPNDVLALQYALTLQHLQLAVYTRALTTYTASSSGFNQSIIDTLTIIRDQEQTQRNYLQAVLDTDATASCTHNLNTMFLSATLFRTNALVIENAVVAAYNGLVDRITDANLGRVLSSFAAVQGRHAAFIASITGTTSSPFPAATDSLNQPTNILTGLSSFITSCPFNLQTVVNGLTIRPDGVGVASNGTVIVTGPRRLTTPTPQYSTEQLNNDIAVLVYLNVFEYIAAALQNTTRFTLTQFQAAGYTQTQYSWFGLIGQQEGAHYAMLNAQLNGRGQTQFFNCYDFSSYNTVASYLQLLAVFERLSQEAYTSAIGFATDTILQRVLATINTVEARHSTFINQLTSLPPVGAGQSIPPPRAPVDVLTELLALTGLQECTAFSTITMPRVVLPARVQGDPAFSGFHGQSFQVHGLDGHHFNLISTATLQINSLFSYLTHGQSMTATQQRHARLRNKFSVLPATKAFDHDGTFLTAFGIKISGASEHRIHVRAGSYTSGFQTVELNGKTVDVSTNQLNFDQSSDIYMIRPTSSILVIVTPVVRFTLVNSDSFINVEHASVDQHWFTAWKQAQDEKASTDHQMEGLLGQSINPSWKPSPNPAFREHQVMDYWVDGDIFSDAFTLNRYLMTKQQ